MDIDFEEYISQSIITNDEKSVSVETKQIKDYSYMFNDVCYDVAVKDNDFTVSDEEESLLSLKQKMSEHFACDRCRQVFDTSTEFKQHVDSHECHRKYKTKAELKQISDGNPFFDQAHQTNKSINKNDVQEANWDDTTDILQCEECGKPCNGEKALREHWLTHGRRQCKNCSTWFMNVKDFEEHMLGCGGKQKLVGHQRVSVSKIPQEERKNDGKFVCVDCGRVCASKAGLVRHMVSHKPRRSRHS